MDLDTIPKLLTLPELFALEQIRLNQLFYYSWPLPKIISGLLKKFLK